LEEAKQGKRRVYFVDASHFVHAAYLGYVWCFVRCFIKSPSGRKRFNILGALDAITKELITVRNDTYVNAQTVCELLKKIAERNMNIPITIFLDNARYQKCELVQQMAVQLNIALVYLPSYSPNLNLIERFWKFTKKKCLYSKYYESFGCFKSAIENVIDHAHIKHKNELETLLTLKFQSFKNVNIMTV
jgi:transposase